MKKTFLLMIVAMMVMPLFGVRASTPDLQIGQVCYTNKSPFVLEGKAEAGSEVEIHGQRISFKVGEDGTFKVELKIEEGVNLFAITAAKNGMSSTKGFMVEMKTTPPEVTLLIKDKLTQEKEVTIKTYDVTKFAITGFTQPGCTILVDDVDYSSGETKFEAKFKFKEYPSKTEHKLDVRDKYGNQTKIKVNSTNIHVKVVKMQMNDKTATVDGQQFSIYPPRAINGLTLLPARFLVETVLGGSIEYDETTYTGKITAENKTVILKMGQRVISVNGISYDLKYSYPILINIGIIMVPVNFLREIFGFYYSYNRDSETITMTKDIYP